MALAHAADGAATMRAIRAAFSKAADPLLVEAESDGGKWDVKSKVDAAELDAMLDQAVSEYTSRFGGRAV
jgi:hypothetical protein